MHAKRLLYGIHVPSLVLIAQAVFLLERGQTDETERPTHDGGYAGMGNKEGPKLNSRENVDCVYDKMWTASGSTVNDLDSDGANVRLLSCCLTTLTYVSFLWCMYLMLTLSVHAVIFNYSDHIHYYVSADIHTYCGCLLIILNATINVEYSNCD